MSTALLILGLCAAAATLVTLVRVRHPSQLSILVMAVSWIVGELALAHLVLQVIVTGILVALGALEESAGVVGLVAMMLSWVGLLQVQRTAGRARGVLATALADRYPDAAEKVRAQEPPRSRLLRPFHFERTDIERTIDIAYGPETRHRLDVYRPEVDVDGGHPILVYVHGGAWISGDKAHQGLPLLHQAARRGWLAVAVTYRIGPKDRFPAAPDDVNRALEWLRDHAGEHGGNPDFIGISGGSAGGHIASLVALSPPAGSGGVDACVPVYATSDFTDSHGIRGYATLQKFLERSVMASTLADDAEGWDAASPIRVATDGAPPFLVIQGANDVFVWREETRAFVEQLRSVSREPVLYAEVPGAQHAFDIFHSVRSAAAADATIAFLDAVHASKPATAR